MQNIEQAYARRDFGVTLFRTGLIALLGAGAATLYLLAAVSGPSASYGGACFGVTAALILLGAVITYAPAQRALRASGIRGGTILRHTPALAGSRPDAERDILAQLERDLDF